jgi:DNA topoisomerase-1
VVKQVSQQLGNTPAVCRSCYIHPAVIDAYFESHENAPLADALNQHLDAAAEETSDDLTGDVGGVLLLLRRRLAS